MRTFSRTIGDVQFRRPLSFTRSSSFISLAGDVCERSWKFSLGVTGCEVGASVFLFSRNFFKISRLCLSSGVLLSLWLCPVGVSENRLASKGTAKLAAAKDRTEPHKTGIAHRNTRRRTSEDIPFTQQPAQNTAPLAGLGRGIFVAKNAETLQKKFEFDTNSLSFPPYLSLSAH